MALRHTSVQPSSPKFAQVRSVSHLVMDTNVKNLFNVPSKFKRCLFSFIRLLIAKTPFIDTHCSHGRHWSPCKVRGLVVLGSLVLAAVITSMVVTLTSIQNRTSTLTTAVTGIDIVVRRLAVNGCIANHLQSLVGQNEK